MMNRQAFTTVVRQLSPSRRNRVLLTWYPLKTTRYFNAFRTRSDRAPIREEWILRAIQTPIREEIQTDGRIRRWARVPEMDGRFLRVILLNDGETVRNAFFDRRFKDK